MTTFTSEKEKYLHRSCFKFSWQISIPKPLTRNTDKWPECNSLTKSSTGPGFISCHVIFQANYARRFPLVLNTLLHEVSVDIMFLMMDGRLPTQRKPEFVDMKSNVRDFNMQRLRGNFWCVNDEF